MESIHRPYLWISGIALEGSMPEVQSKGVQEGLGGALQVRGVVPPPSGGLVMKISRLAGYAALAALASFAVYQAQLKAG
jgi:hypothetical protein